MSVIQKHVKSVMERHFIDYAMSVITDRALPDVRDGLKPVHRRILYAMYEAGNTHNKGYKKSARMVGDVIGKYHPHGDTSVYNAAVRMAQPFSMQCPLIDGQGNFGSVDGDNPAAMRYTEMRLTRLAGEMFDDIGRETVGFQPNYDGNEKEPVVLPSGFPTLLVNGGEGIAVGMASSIPPHNLSDVIECCIALLDNPNLESQTIVSILKAPDFPTYGLVHDLDGFSTAVETGRGRIRIRSRWHEEARGRGASSIVITEIPYQVNKTKLIEKIADLVNERKIEDIVALRDESNKEGMRIVIDVRAGASCEIIFSQLLDSTDLDISVNYNCVVIDQGQPKLLGLRDILVKWLEFRHQVILARHVYIRKQTQARLHILEGFVRALNDAERTIQIIREAASVQDAKRELMEAYGLDETQAQSVLDLRLQKLTSMEVSLIEDEHRTATQKVAELTEIIESPARIESIVREELLDIQKRYGEPRKSEIRMDLSAIQREDLIEREDVLIITTDKGYIKRIPVSSLSEQNRRTRGKRMMTLDEGDDIGTLIQCSTHDQIMVFTSSGQVFSTKAYRIPETSSTSKARHIRNVIEGLDEEIRVILSLPEKDETMSVVTVSKNAQVKRSLIEDYANAGRKGGIRGVTLDDGDELIAAFSCHAHDHLMLACNTGRAIRFDIEDVRVTGRSAMGVRGMRLDDNEWIVGSHMIQGTGQPCPVVTVEREIDGEIKSIETMDTSTMDTGLYFACIGSRGAGKRTPISEFTVQSRGGKGLIALKLTAKTGDMVAALGLTDADDLVLFSSQGISNRVWASNIQQSGRVTSGSFIMNLDEGTTVTKVTRAKHEEDEQSD